MLGKSAKYILPNGGLMVIRHGTKSKITLKKSKFWDVLAIGPIFKSFFAVRFREGNNSTIHIFVDRSFFCCRVFEVHILHVLP